MAYSTINKSRNNFNTILWTGNGSLPRAITGVGFSPDLVWAKDRDTAYNPQWHDSVRGIDEGAIYSNANNAIMIYMAWGDRPAHTPFGIQNVAR